MAEAELKIELEDARRMCRRIHGNREEAEDAGRQLRQAGYSVNLILEERVRADGRAILLATVLHPDVDAVPEPVGVISYRPPQVPRQRMKKDPGAP